MMWREEACPACGAIIGRGCPEDTEEEREMASNRESKGPLCMTHGVRDTNADGECSIYGTASPQMKGRMRACHFLGSPTGGPRTITVTLSESQYRALMGHGPEVDTEEARSAVRSAWMRQEGR